MRNEFPRSVKVAVIKRATRDKQVYCEACKLPTRKWQIDHVIADAHGGSNKIENAELICEVCYGIKNPKDTKVAAKLKRAEAFGLGATKPNKQKIASRNTLRKSVGKVAKMQPPRRGLYERIG